MLAPTIIHSNLKTVQENIAYHCEKIGKDPGDITLIAVSKTMPNSVIETAIQAGHTLFGENKVQELKDKVPYFKDKASFHMIGHLQTNKVKYLIHLVTLIHSVDSLKLAEKINEVAKQHKIIMPILIQVNVADENSKFGLAPDEVLNFIQSINHLEHILVKGLMTVAPYVVDANENRPIFRKMKEISVDIKRQNIDNVTMDVLSMGMSNDYGIAIEEGATMVRVGSSIFGER